MTYAFLAVADAAPPLDFCSSFDLRKQLGKEVLRLDTVHHISIADLPALHAQCQHFVQRLRPNRDVGRIVVHGLGQVPWEDPAEVRRGRNVFRCRNAMNSVLVAITGWCCLLLVSFMGTASARSPRPAWAEVFVWSVPEDNKQRRRVRLHCLFFSLSACSSCRLPTCSYVKASLAAVNSEPSTLCLLDALIKSLPFDQQSSRKAPNLPIYGVDIDTGYSSLQHTFKRFRLRLRRIVVSSRYRSLDRPISELTQTRFSHRTGATWPCCAPSRVSSGRTRRPSL